ncbi:type II secretion system F family protein [Romboutsia sp.]|uniref:type II secretion system F family protein n=1 Tax=Romboutsia sp. TaxID=1965302 RepID=UPI002BAAE125|nr:type II secretion system F family protein [Romboutsia sp.]HSQ88775.1 type II secretion system F family protein [Romboutsia sp.]
MGLYKCVVYDKDKKRKNLKIELDSEEEINNYISINELTMVSIKTIDNKESIKLKEKELKILCRQMGILLESGCEITKMIEILRNQSNNKISNILSEIANHIQRGNSITESFQKSKLFSTFFISMIKAGEVSGKLDTVMYSLADYYDKEDKVKSKIKTVSIYPTILLVLSAASMLIIMTMVIPRFEMIFISNGMNPPLLTKILINISSFIRTTYIYIIIVILGIIPTSIHFIRNSTKVIRLKNNLKFKTPVIKNITQLVITTRFCRALSMLVESGVQIIDAIDISAKIIDNKFIYEKLLISKGYIEKGNSIGHSLNLFNVFPKLFISMINIGEESGRLEESLKTIDSFYSNDLDTKIERIMRLIEPIIILIIGVIIGIFMVAMVMPMFDAIVSI